jgi:hypothetical protein
MLIAVMYVRMKKQKTRTSILNILRLGSGRARYSSSIEHLRRMWRKPSQRPYGRALSIIFGLFVTFMVCWPPFLLPASAGINLPLRRQGQVAQAMLRKSRGALAGNLNSSQQWLSLFNGRDLTGWDGDPRFWSVQDGVIRGETTLTKLPLHNTFLIWRGGQGDALHRIKPDPRVRGDKLAPAEAGVGLQDFILKIKFRIRNGNSGIQYRSKEFDKWRVSGYQAEVENTPGKVGFLYHEAGRGWLTDVGDFMVIDKNGKKNVISKVADKDELIKAGYYKKKDWNEYTIIAQGNHIVHYLNGYQTIELIDNDRLTDPNNPKDRKGAARQGLLALQIHIGLPMLVEFKDIRIKRLEPKYGDAVLLFNGRDLDNWQVKGDKEDSHGAGAQKSKWVIGTAKVLPEDTKLLANIGGHGEMLNLARKDGDGIDIYTKEKFGDCRIELQLIVPKGSNSGIYCLGEYEVQVLDSYGKAKMDQGDMGAIYGAAPPAVNACKKPGEWQKYIIEFQAPKFDSGGKRTENAKFLKVELNGQLLHENLEIPGPTPGGVTGREAPTGPLMFQGNHGPVAFRNVILKPILEY